MGGPARAGSAGPRTPATAARDVCADHRCLRVRVAGRAPAPGGRRSLPGSRAWRGCAVERGRRCQERDASPIERLLVTDTVETQPVELSSKVEVVSVAPLFGEAIRRIHQRESVSVLFPK